MAGGSASAFNVKDAMGRLMNNKNLYNKLLTKFMNEYGDFYDKVKVAADAGNYDDLIHLAHTMKGLAGNLGAEDLQAASKDLEAGAKSATANPDELETFREELERALNEVRAGVDLG